MIKQIEMNIACYKKPTFIITDKKINFIYGLNGTGKSTISDFLYKRSEPKYSNCKIEGVTTEKILVYNQSFIHDYFYEDNNLKGVFTLSKENKKVEETIKIAENEIIKLQEEKKEQENEYQKIQVEMSNKRQQIANKVWEIKTNYTGGDRILEFCLDNLKSDKNKLLEYLLKIDNPKQKPENSIEKLKKESETIKDTAEKFNIFQTIDISINSIEKDSIFNKIIVGNENTSVADLIKKLNNSDWVKKGLDYISGDICPFCQSKTISKQLIKNIKEYFDETYDLEIKKIENYLTQYTDSINSIKTQIFYKSNMFIKEEENEFDSLYIPMITCLNSNKQKISDKKQFPSHSITLDSSVNLIKKLNDFLITINDQISQYNKKIDNKIKTKDEIKKKFWNLMRFNYSQIIEVYQLENKQKEDQKNEISKRVLEIEKKIELEKNNIKEQQKKTVNIKEAIDNINNELINLGLDSFSIKKHSNNLYKIVRDGEDKNAFFSLSEGEKTVISFLYFVELCKGKQNEEDVNNEKIIIIDDPISSLSHIFIFNIAELIKTNFLKKEYKQVFILTHSLYFFHELIKSLKGNMIKNLKIFRLNKNKKCSEISEIDTADIQNSYQTFWTIVKDSKNHPALVANCMRQILEYFFNFTERIELKELFEKEALKSNKYIAFNRYINRESHSTGDNIFDIKEFDYDVFKEAFCLVFKENGYENHYKIMME